MPRLYLPLTWAQLRELHGSGEVPAGVARLRAEGEDEEAEYDALQGAADASAQLLDGPGRRVVVVAEAPDDDAPIALARVVAVHADDEPLDPASAAYDDPPELGWWATQEIAELLRLESR